ncbi:hypothetical protein ACIRD6_36795 [Streptomyces sp. NPDC102473]
METKGRGVPDIEGFDLKLDRPLVQGRTGDATAAGVRDLGHQRD